jgi:polysaccharide deacetylase 2 family uncharacterized protein YibQ
MISSWYLPCGVCFPFGSKYSVSIDITKRKELGIIQKFCLILANCIIESKERWQNVIKLSILIILRYSYKNLEIDDNLMATRKRKKSTHSSKILTYIAWGLAIVAMVLSSLVAGYYFGYEDAQADISKQTKLEQKKRLALLKKLEKTPQEKKKTTVNKRLKEVLKKETKHYVSASHEFDDTALAKPPKMAERKVKLSPVKPMLAIIIDDVGTSSQVNAIKSLNIPLTMSFLPPSKARPHSAKLAAKEKLYMVHLPLEAQSFSAEEPDTLRISDSQRKISQRIRNIKNLFPKVRHINNHTGSKFTSDEVAMNRLIYALNANNISFIDSRTTAETKAPKVLKNFGLNYVARDVFLDHHMDKKYIKGQIKKAIQVAKKHGTAIAIGHPHANTILALNESKKLLKEVELVYINRLN